eukprot:5216846-Pleurochrysis_carterae.AAC.1
MNMQAWSSSVSRSAQSRVEKRNGNTMARAEAAEDCTRLNRAHASRVAPSGSHERAPGRRSAVPTREHEHRDGALAVDDAAAVALRREHARVAPARTARGAGRSAACRTPSSELATGRRRTFKRFERRHGGMGGSGERPRERPEQSASVSDRFDESGDGQNLRFRRGRED